MWRTSSLNESMLERDVSVSCFIREPLEPIRNESCFVNVFNRFIKKDPTHMNDSFTNRTCICCHLSSADMFQQVLYQNILTFCTWINDKYATNYKFNFSYWSLFWNATTSVKEINVRDFVFAVSFSVQLNKTLKHVDVHSLVIYVTYMKIAIFDFIVTFRRLA